jgi:putative nucleotidyltransferase with HDIG domain
MKRDEALEIVKKYTEKEITFRHLISVEGVMRALARHFGEDEDTWGFAGLWHDLDYDQTADDFDRHTHLTVEWLKAEGMNDETILNAILAHKYEDHRHRLIDTAIVHADAVAGLIVASALVRPEKSNGMKVSSVKKKLKEKSFAPGVEREEIKNVEESLGIPLDEFLAIAIQGVQDIAPEIELV